MPVLSISVEKVKAKRYPEIPYRGGPITFIPKPSFIDIIEAQVKVSGSKHLLIPFKHTMIYKPRIGFFRIMGHILYQTSDEKKEEIVSLWKKRKRVPDDVFVELMTHLTSHALFLETNLAWELGLPPPIRLPRLKAE